MSGKILEVDGNRIVFSFSKSGVRKTFQKLAVAVLAVLICTGFVFYNQGQVKNADAASSLETSVKSLNSQILSVSSDVYGLENRVNSHDKVDLVLGSAFTWTRNGTTATGKASTNKLILNGATDRISKIAVNYRSDLADYDLKSSYSVDKENGILTVTLTNVSDASYPLITSGGVREMLIYTVSTR